MLKTENQKISEIIKKEILSGEFKPGERLPQRKLAEKYQSTTIVVREALRILENEGLVCIEPKWGAMVEDISPKKLYGRYVVREALEGMAARIVARQANDMEKNELLELAKQCDVKLLGNELTKAEKAKLHYKLHEKIVALSRCDELIDLVKKISLYSVLLSNAFHIDWTSDEKNWHQKLVTAIINGDPDFAESEMRRHVRRGYQDEAAALNQHDMM